MKTLNFTTIGGETNKLRRNFLNQLSFLILSIFTFFLISCSCMPPVASNQTFEVCEHISDSEVIGTVEASDPENNALTYKIIDNGGGLFEIDAGSGDISLISGQSLSYTNLAQHAIGVQVSNLSLTKDVIVRINVLIPAPSYVSNLAYSFTYNEQASFLISNNGGDVESFSAINGTLPAGLKLTNRNGELFIEGIPSQLTLEGAVSVEIAASNKCGSNRSSVDVTVNPILVAGDQSPGIVHAEHSNAANNDSALIHKASNIPFASGGTGAYNDPILIGISSDATGISFVVDYNDVSIPVSNFASLALSNQTFSIQLLNIPAGAIISNFILEYSQALDANNRIDVWFEPFITRNNPVSLVSGDTVGIDFSAISGGFVVATNMNLIINVQQRLSGVQQTLDSRLRFSLDIIR